MPLPKVSFLDSVNHMVDRALATVELAPGLPELDRRLEEARGEQILRVFREMLGREVREVREVKASRRNVPDLRTAAFVVAIEKIADFYLDMGHS